MKADKDMLFWVTLVMMGVCFTFGWYCGKDYVKDKYTQEAKEERMKTLEAKVEFLGRVMSVSRGN